jgi:hypothetical protein
MTVEERLQKLENKVFENDESKNWLENKILEMAKNIGRLKTGGFYIEQGERRYIHKDDIESHIKMLTASICYEAKNLISLDIK